MDNYSNRFLNHSNHPEKVGLWVYPVGIMLIIVFYLSGGLIATMPLINKLIANGYSMEYIKNNKNLIFNSDATEFNVNIIMTLQFLIFIIAFFGVLIIPKIHRRPFISFVTGNSYFQWKYFFFGIIFWGLCNIFLFTTSFFLERENLIFNYHPKDFFVMVPLLFLFVPIQTFVEEFVYRSYLLHFFKKIFKNGIPAVLISSLLFSLSHASNPEIKAFGFKVMLLFYFIFGLGLCIITSLTEGIEAAWAIHLIHNLLSGIFVTSENSVLKTPALFVSRAQNAWSELFFVFICLSFIILYLMNKFKLRLDSNIFK